MGEEAGLGPDSESTAAQLMYPPNGPGTYRPGGTGVSCHTPTVAAGCGRRGSNPRRTASAPQAVAPASSERPHLGMRGTETWTLLLQISNLRIAMARSHGFTIYGFTIYGFTIYGFTIYGFTIYGSKP